MDHDILASVVRVRSAAITGTGYLVSSAGLVVTCAHVVRGAAGPTVAFVGGAAPLPARVVLYHAAADLALLQVEGALPPAAQPIPLGQAEDPRNHPFRSYGFPHGLDAGLHAQGAVVGGTFLEGQAVYQLASAELTEGFSGGPIYDEQARRVIGTARAVLRPDHLGKLTQTAFCIPTATLLALYPALAPSAVQPYRGLAHFTEAHAEFFFGRERLLDPMLERLRREPRFLALVGPSGSGKSSLVQAGLIPRLRAGALPDSEHWQVLVSRPSDDPLGTIAADGLPGAEADLVAAAREALARRPECRRLLIVIDQFEEVLVRCPAARRSAFIAQLLRLLGSSAPISVVLTLRDDLFSSVDQLAPGLIEWLNVGQVLISSAIENQDLTRIVAGPADLVGLRFEPGLVDRIVDDSVRAVPGPEGVTRVARSTTLPLLEFTLARLWERRRDGVLSHAAYAKIGAVTGALFQWADEALAGLDEALAQPDATLRPLARRVFGDLVYLGDAARAIPDIRQRRSLAELCRGAHERAAVEQIVDHFARHRLIVRATVSVAGRTSDTCDLIHDALLEWPSLQAWIERDRAFLAWRQQIERKVQEWAESGPAPQRRAGGKLIQDRQDLAVARAYLQERAADLRDDERAYLQASLDRRRRRLITALVAAALIVALVGGITLFVRAQAAGAVAQQREVALVTDLLAQAQAISAERPADSALAGLLAIEADRRAPSLESEAALYQTALWLPRRARSATLPLPTADQAWRRQIFAYDAERDRAFVGSSDGRLATVSLGDPDHPAEATYRSARNDASITTILPDAPQGRVFVALNTIAVVQGEIGAPGDLLVADLQTLAEIRRIELDEYLSALTLAPDRSLLAAGGYDGALVLFAADDLAERARLSCPGYVSAIAFSRDMSHIAAACGPVTGWRRSSAEEGFARVWRLSDGQLAAEWSLGQLADSPERLEFSPDGRRLLVDAQLWDIAERRDVAALQGAGGDLSADGRHLAVADLATVRLGALAGDTLSEITLSASIQGSTEVSFSPLGSLLLARDSAAVARVLRSADGAEILRVPGATFAQFSGGGATLVTIGPDGAVSEWLLDSPAATRAARFSRAAQLMVTVGTEDVAYVHRLADGRVRPIAAVLAADIAPGGRYLALARPGDLITVLDLEQNRELFTKAAPVAVRDVRFAADGLLLIVSERSVVVWTVPDGGEQARWADVAPIQTLRIGADGALVAVETGFARPREQTIVWRTADGSTRARFTSSQAGSISPDVRFALIPDGAGALRLEALAAGSAPQRLNPAVPDRFAPTFSADGSTFVIWAEGALEIWEAATTRRVQTIVTDAAFAALSDDGALVAARRGDLAEEITESAVTILVFEARTGRRLAAITLAHSLPDESLVLRFTPDNLHLLIGRPHDFRDQVAGLNLARIVRLSDQVVVAGLPAGMIADAAFTPDGAVVALTYGEVSPLGLVTPTGAGYLRWRRADLIGEACARIGRSLTAAEWAAYLPGFPYRQTCEGRP